MSSPPPNGFTRLLAELRRRRVFRAAGIYAAACFVVLQAADLAVAPLSLPSWTMTLLWVAAIAGFPLALVLAWAFDVVPAAATTPVPGPPPPAASATSSSRRARAAAIAAAAVLVLGGGGAFIALRPAAAVGDRSIAVLPFDDLSPGADQAFLSDGITEDILTRLSRMPGLRVISRTSVMTYKGSAKTVPQIASELGVAYVLEGSVRRVDDRLRVSAQLIRAGTDEHVWADEFDRDLTDVLALQGDIATRIAEALRFELSPEDRERLRGRDAPTDPVAYELYLRGRAFFDRVFPGQVQWRAEERAAELLLRQALQTAPDFAPAWSALARLPSILAQPDSASHYARRAIELDPRDAEAHYVLAVVARADDRADEARALYRRTLQLDPNHPAARQAIAGELQRSGRLAEAVREYERVIAVNPASAPAYGPYVDLLQRLGLNERALRLLRERLLPRTDQPGYAECHQAYVLIALGDSAGAAAAIDRQLARDRDERPYECAAAVHFALGRLDRARVYYDSVLAIRARTGSTMRNRLIEVVLALDAGDTAAGERKLREWIENSRHGLVNLRKRGLPAGYPFYMIARAHAQLGEHDRAVAALDTMLLEGWATAELRHDPYLRALRGDPEFQRIVARSEARIRQEVDHIRQEGW